MNSPSRVGVVLAIGVLGAAVLGVAAWGLVHSSAAA
jgi:hypothetical protein